MARYTVGWELNDTSASHDHDRLQEHCIRTNRETQLSPSPPDLVSVRQISLHAVFGLLSQLSQMLGAGCQVRRHLMPRALSWKWPC